MSKMHNTLSWQEVIDFSPTPSDLDVDCTIGQFHFRLFAHGVLPSRNEHKHASKSYPTVSLDHLLLDFPVL